MYGCLTTGHLTNLTACVVVPIVVPSNLILDVAPRCACPYVVVSVSVSEVRNDDDVPGGGQVPNGKHESWSQHVLDIRSRNSGNDSIHSIRNNDTNVPVNMSNK